MGCSWGAWHRTAAALLRVWCCDLQGGSTPAWLLACPQWACGLSLDCRKAAAKASQGAAGGAGSSARGTATPGALSSSGGRAAANRMRVRAAASGGGGAVPARWDGRRQGRGGPLKQGAKECAGPVWFEENDWTPGLHTTEPPKAKKRGVRALVARALACALWHLWGLRSCRPVQTRLRQARSKCMLRSQQNEPRAALGGSRGRAGWELWRA